MIELPVIAQILILAVVQGVTEFLPVSSSGHLVIIGAWLSGATGNLELIVALHLGTLGSIIIFYWHRMWALLSEDRRVIPMLIIASIPTVILGLTLRIFFKEVLEEPLLAGCMLPITGLLLIWMSRARQGTQTYRDIRIWQAVVIGLSQAFALLPGISRSGSTISAGALVGLQRQQAATFSFLMAIPALAGATLLEFVKIVAARREPIPEIVDDAAELLDQPVPIAWETIGLGAFVAFVVGLISLKILSTLIDRGQLHWFAFWVIPLGVVTVFWRLALVS